MAKQKKRIILTGAQGTGKTTLMNALAVDGTRTFSVARDVALEDGWTPESVASEAHQKKVFDALHKALSSKKSYISDRGLTCVAAYTADGVMSGSISKKFADKQIAKLVKFHNSNPDTLIVYTPIEFPIVGDGVRDTDTINQYKIDFIIRELLDSLNIKYITVTGSVEERVKQIEDALNA